MFKLLKGGTCHVPDNIGRKDVLLAFGKVCRIGDDIPSDGLWDLELFNCKGKIVCPGFIDQHIHITGGGGEEGPASRIPPLDAGDLFAAGVTTAVGVLGLDGITRSIADLLFKARSLEAEGIRTFIYTGSYAIPTATLTGRVSGDMAFIDKVVGAGEIAISDYRSSHPSFEQLKALAAEVKTGGLIGAKAGIIHIHVGDGKEGLDPLIELVERTNYSMDMFIPTHVNRNRRLFIQAADYCKKGGLIDLTAGENSDEGLKVPDALKILRDKGIDLSRVSVSSDGNGSMPSGNGGARGVGRVATLLEDFRESVLEKDLSFSDALRTVTSNVARILRIHPPEGMLSVGSRADLLVFDGSTLELEMVFSGGEVYLEGGCLIQKAGHEKNTDGLNRQKI